MKLRLARTVFLTTLLTICLQAAFAQKYMTRTGKITFYSSTPLESIDARNNEVATVVDAKSGDIVFQLLQKSFKFERDLMQEHFNENYMESDKYPKADFKGKIAGEVNYTKDGTYNVKANGKLTMHGVTRDISVPGTLTVKGNTIVLKSKFNLVPQDYGIKIPSLVASKIAKEIEVTVNSELSQIQK